MRPNESAVVAPHEGRTGRLLSWIKNHDDSWFFIITYIGAAVLLSVLVSLFWLVAVVGVHFAFEYIRHREPGDSALRISVRAAWEVLLDIGLVLFALILAVYLEVIFGAVGIGAGARLGVQAASRVGTRVAAWQRAIRGILLSLDDVVQVGRSLKRPAKTALQSTGENDPETPAWGGWQRPWSRGDKLTVGLALVCLLLLVVSPVLTGMSAMEVAAILLDELRPIP